MNFGSLDTKKASAEFLLGRLFEKYTAIRAHAYSDTAEHLLNKTIAQYFLMEVANLMNDMGYSIEGVDFNGIYVGWIDSFERRSTGHEKEIYFCEKCDMRIASKYAVHCDSPLLHMREIKK